MPTSNLKAGFASRISYISKNQGAKLLQTFAARSDKGVRIAKTASVDENAARILNKIAVADPTKNGAYMQWLTNCYIGKQFLIEDLGRIKGELTTFEKIKNKIKDMDIVNMTMGQLYDVVDANKEKAEEKSMAEIEREIKANGAEKVISVKDFMVIALKTKEAAMYYGKGTRWCTAAESSENAFDSYNSQGTLYVVIVNDKDGKQRKFQFHIQSGQAMDERDISIVDNQANIELLSSFDEYYDFLNMLDASHYTIVENDTGELMVK